MLLLFQLKIIIPDLDWGRKINFCSFSLVTLNMEHVIFSYTFHLLDTHLPRPYLTLYPSQENERKEGKNAKERGREDGEKERKF